MRASPSIEKVQEKDQGFAIDFFSAGCFSPLLPFSPFKQKVIGVSFLLSLFLFAAFLDCLLSLPDSRYAVSLKPPALDWSGLHPTYFSPDLPK